MGEGYRPPTLSKTFFFFLKGVGSRDLTDTFAYLTFGNARNFLPRSGASRASEEPEVLASSIGYAGLLLAQTNLQFRHKNDPRGPEAGRERTRNVFF